MALDFSPLKILIVDDNEFMRRLLRELLVALNCQPANLRFAANGRLRPKINAAISGRQSLAGRGRRWGPSH
jgi:CheY-like chemotaxis protein